MKSRELFMYIVWLLFGILLLLVGVYNESCWIVGFGIYFLAPAAYGVWRTNRGNVVFSKKFVLKEDELGFFLAIVPGLIKEGRVLVYFENEQRDYNGAIRVFRKGCNDQCITKHLKGPFIIRQRGLTVSPVIIEFCFDALQEGELCVQLSLERRYKDHKGPHAVQIDVRA